MDEFSLTTIMTAQHRIDSSRFPQLASMAATSTWYRNHTTVSDNTLSAVPSILTGQRPATGPSINIDRSHNIYNMLKSRYRVNGYESITHLCSDSLCREPKEYKWLAGKKVVGSAESRIRLRKVAQMIHGIRGGGSKPLLWAVHAIFPHVPWSYLPNGDQYDDEALTYPGMFAYAWLGQNHEYEVALEQQRMIMQAQFADRIIGALRAKLVKTGLWDKAMVVVTADHGISFKPGQEHRSIGSGNFGEIAGVPLLVKYPGQKARVVSHQSTRSIDILPTIAAATGASSKYRGRTLQSSPTGEEVVVRNGQKRENERMSMDGMLALQDAAIAQRDARFPNSSLYHRADNQTVMGRRVSQFASVAGASSGTVQIDSPGFFRNARPGSGWLPSSYLSTHTRGLRAGVPIAVAINGRIAGTGKTFLYAPPPFFPDGPEARIRLAIMLDPAAIKRGRVSLRFYRQTSSGLQRISVTK